MSAVPPIAPERLKDLIAKSNDCLGQICTKSTAYSVIEGLRNNPPPLTDVEKAKLRALGVWDALTGAADAAGKSYGVTGTPESRAAWAVETSEAAVKGIAAFIDDPKGVMEKFRIKASSDDPKDVRETSSTISSFLLAAATAKAASNVAKGSKPKAKSAGDGTYSDKKKVVIDPAVIAARRKLAEDFYAKSGMPPSKIDGHMNGIDFTKPVDIVTVDKNTVLSMYPNEPGVQGNYYFPVSNGSSPSSLGISGQYTNAAGVLVDKIPETYVTTRPVEMLRSTAAAIEVTWVTPTVQTVGGAPQFFSMAKDAFSRKGR